MANLYTPNKIVGDLGDSPHDVYEMLPPKPTTNFTESYPIFQESYNFTTLYALVEALDWHNGNKAYNDETTFNTDKNKIINDILLMNSPQYGLYLKLYLSNLSASEINRTHYPIYNSMITKKATLEDIITKDVHSDIMNIITNNHELKISYSVFPNIKIVQRYMCQELLKTASLLDLEDAKKVTDQKSVIDLFNNILASAYDDKTVEDLKKISSIKTIIPIVDEYTEFKTEINTTSINPDIQPKTIEQIFKMFKYYTTWNYLTFIGYKKDDSSKLVGPGIKYNAVNTTLLTNFANDINHLIHNNEILDDLLQKNNNDINRIFKISDENLAYETIIKNKDESDRQFMEKRIKQQSQYALLLLTTGFRIIKQKIHELIKKYKGIPIQNYDSPNAKKYLEDTDRIFSDISSVIIQFNQDHNYKNFKETLFKKIENVIYNLCKMYNILLSRNNHMFLTPDVFDSNTDSSILSYIIIQDIINTLYVDINVAYTDQIKYDGYNIDLKMDEHDYINNIKKINQYIKNNNIPVPIINFGIVNDINLKQYSTPQSEGLLIIGSGLSTFISSIYMICIIVAFVILFYVLHHHKKRNYKYRPNTLMYYPPDNSMYYFAGNN